MNHHSTLRAARSLARRKGLVLRKLRGDRGFALGQAAGLASLRPAMIFPTLQDAIAEIRMH